MALYIPKRIKVGYQPRTDTYTGKLAYIIYFDDKQVLRKEKSWEGWRDKKIPAEEYDNVPTSGMILNKDIKRYNSWSHFSSKRTMIRVWDPRGIEIEITTENLIGVLMHSDCCKRQLMGEYVYAWDGTELVLLPTCSEEYQQATQYTALQAGKVGAKDLVPGRGYRTKQEDDLIYVGRFPWFEMDDRWSRKDVKERSSKRYHVFAARNEHEKTGKASWSWVLKTNVDFLAIQTTEQPVEEYASIVEAFQGNTHSSAIAKWDAKPGEVSLELNNPDHYHLSLKENTYFKRNGDVIEEWTIYTETESYQEQPGGNYKYRLAGFQIHRDCSYDISTNQITYHDRYDQYAFRRYGYTRNLLTGADLQIQGFCHLHCTLENGRRIKVKSLSSL